MKLPYNRIKVLIYLTIICQLSFFSSKLYSQEKEFESVTSLEGVDLNDYELIDFLKREIDSHPNQSKYWLMLGSAWEGIQMYDSSAIAYERGFEIDSSCVKCKQKLAGVIADKGMVKDAINLYQATLKLDSTSTSARIQLAQLLKRESRFSDALQQFEWLLRNDTTNFYLWEQVGDCSMRIDSIAAAINAYNRSFAINPANMPLAVKLINAFLQSGIPPSFFINIANTALEYDSTYIPLIRTKGYLLFLSQDYKESELWFHKALQLGDSIRFTYKFLGINQYHNGSYYSSANYLGKAFAQDTTDKTLNFVYAKALIEIGDRKKAIDILDLTERVITPTNEELGMLYATKAEAQARGQKYTEAIDQYKKALDLNPDHLEYFYEIGLCYYYLKDYKKSHEILSSFLQLAEKEYPKKGSTSKRVPTANFFIKQVEKELFFLDN